LKTQNVIAALREKDKEDHGENVNTSLLEERRHRRNKEADQ
jgi:hypothetical protein